MVIDIFGNAADTVSAHGTLRAVQIVHIHLAVRDLRRADQDQAVGTDAKVAVADKFRHCGRIFDSLLKTVYIYIIVSNAVHFREFHNNNLLIPEYYTCFFRRNTSPCRKNIPVSSSGIIVYWIIVIEK